MKKTKLGFIGCGFMGQMAHLANYATLPDVELAAIADLRTKTAAEVARRYGIHQVCADHTELLSDGDVDAVIAVTSFNLHYSIVPEILNAGRHCLTEKPICVKASTAKQMAKLAVEKGVVYHIGYMKRCDPASRRMKDVIAEWKRSGEFGSLKYLRVSMPPGDWLSQIEGAIDLGDKSAVTPLEPESAPDSMTQDEQKRYSSFINYFIHQVNLIRFLLGEDYSVEFVDKNSVLMACRSTSGVTIALEMNAYEVRDEWHESYQACFDRGFISLSLPAPMARQRSGELLIYRNTPGGGSYERPVIAPVWSMREQARLFVEEIRGNAKCISPAEDAVKDLEVAEQFIFRSRDQK